MQTKRTRALAAAAKFSKPDAGHQYRVFFVDGSSITKPNDNSESSVPGDASVTHLGAAVVYKPREGSQNWQVRYFAILNRRGSTLAEQAAIADGLDIATREAMLVRGQNCIGPKGAAAKVIVFTDSVSALQRIQKIQKSAVTEAQLLGDPIIHKLITRSQYLRRIGVQLELRWVPGHSKVEGNALADTEARYAAKNQDIGVLLGEELRLLDSEVIPNDVNEHDPQNNTRRGKS
ncbi:tick transposon [Trichoderma arundinaceum]|uniref:Tick transposon n=1 Tax=Trichoderma arundinaceum TaxID=490622 RepID=A0A395NHY3_TRIAR|nr:tick transposon [Trichoderma arundinaceum]